MSDEKHVQIVVSLLKQHGIRKIIASPGTTNSGLVHSLTYDGSFQIYSSVDERSAAYLACGLAAESGEAVVITCTGATASRNYLPGLTEAYYRKLPVLAITGTQAYSRIGHHVAQVIDRSVMPKDTVTISVSLPVVKDDLDILDCEIKVNKAILELKRNGGGPAHINLPTTYTGQYNTKELPRYRMIRRFFAHDELPDITKKGKVAVLVGSHKTWSKHETETLERFCESNNAVVFCDHSSGYKGKYKVNFSLVAAQKNLPKAEFAPDLLIHIGEVSGDYPTLELPFKEVWRVSEDGELRDTFKKLVNVFQMPEVSFFNAYSKSSGKNLSYYKHCSEKLEQMSQSIPDNIPFSNIWVASRLHSQIPAGSTLHLGILNSLRAWNFFKVDDSISTASNVGGFGIDGGLSSLIGASFHNPDKLYYCVIGDLAFFYDLNVLGNRHVGKNLRILLINNGTGVEFRQFNHYALQFGEEADKYIAAAGHFGNKSAQLVKNFSQNLGFKYISASSKEEFESVYSEFINPNIQDAPLLFEVFTEGALESKALEMICNLVEKSNEAKLKDAAKNILKQSTVGFFKKVIKG